MLLEKSPFTVRRTNAALYLAPRLPISSNHIVDEYCEAMQLEEDAMPTSVKQLIEAANAVVPKITPSEAREMMAKGNTLIVDVRDAPELEKSGKVAGAVHHSRWHAGISRRSRLTFL
jgi:hypothetical protein